MKSYHNYDKIQPTKEDARNEKNVSQDPLRAVKAQDKEFQEWLKDYQIAGGYW